MSHIHVLVWINDVQAQITFFKNKTVKSQIVHFPCSTLTKYQSLKVSTLTSTAFSDDDICFNEAICDVIQNADSIEIVGKGLAKVSLVVHLAIYYPDLTEKISNIDTTNSLNNRLLFRAEH